MKTSNKLLIAFAAALIVIPILGMVIVSATQYKTGSYSERSDEVSKDDSFNTPTENMSSIAVSSAFTSIILSDAQSLALNINLIKDEKFGVKIPEEYKDLINLNVDENGQLLMAVKERKDSKKNGARFYANIYIYAPNISSLTLANASSLVVKSIADKLNLNLNKIESFYFANGTKLNQLNLDAVQVKDLILRRDKIRSANIVITDTKFAIESMSLDNVAITTNGNSKVAIYEKGDNKTPQIIKNLVLTTNGIADVKIENTTIENCSGKLSDETIVQMPAVNLNQMYNK